MASKSAASKTAAKVKKSIKETVKSLFKSASGKVAASHVLAAMGVAPSVAKGAIRLSLGWDSQESDLHLFSTAWRRVLKHVAPGDPAAA